MPLPLETPRLLIRPSTLDDAESLFEVLGDPEVTRWLPITPADSVEAVRERLITRVQHQAEQGFSMWTVVERSTGAILGSCGLILVEGVGPEVEVAYHFARGTWGQGYASEAAAACVEFGLGELGIERIVAMAFPENLASRRVLEKIGLERVGTVNSYGNELLLYEITRFEPGA